MTLKHFCLAVALSLVALAGPVGCSAFDRSAPIAGETLADERAAIAVESAYQAAAIAVETAIDAGYVTPAQAEKLAVYEAQAYNAVLAARVAYDAGQGLSYDAAISAAQAAISAIILTLNEESKPNGP